MSVPPGGNLIFGFPKQLLSSVLYFYALLCTFISCFSRVLYETETWSFALRQEHKLCENDEFGKIFGLKCEWNK
jgi:hypothetical protein